MELSFEKYQGTGNDFIILDGWDKRISLTEDQIRFCCDRRFGIGADGLMVIHKHPEADFEMLYYNADGKPGSMCGNGGRCIVKYAFSKGYVKNTTRFLAVDGLHEASILPDGIISLRMGDVTGVNRKGEDFFLNTGSPHYVRYAKKVENFDVVGEGKAIRYNEEFRQEGTNVNFIEWQQDILFVRTYERGVEDETLSCGTGVTASALVTAFLNDTLQEGAISVKTLGGALKVCFKKSGNGFTDIKLEGPAEYVFDGKIKL